MCAGSGVLFTPESGEAMAGPAGTALPCSACISLSCRGPSSAMVKALLGPRGIAVTHNSWPASEPTAGKTLIYSRSSLRVRVGFKF